MTLKIIWFSDLHLRAEANPARERTERRIKACLDDAVRHHPDADLCVISGDIAHGGIEAEYSRFAHFGFDRWPGLHLLPGNHDDPDRLARLTGHQSRYWPKSIQAGGFDLLFLDSTLPASSGGRIGSDGLDAIDKLCSAPDTQVLVFLHHQPAPTFIPSADTIGLADQPELAALLARHQGKVAHMFFGHCHLPISGSLHGTGFTGLPATAIQQFPNFADARFIAAPEMPPAYGVILAQPGSIAVHTVTVPEPN